MSSTVSVFGIRHHGPGSARRLVEALDELAPTIVLIEGPADATPLLGLLTHPDMVPPVAILLSNADSTRTSFVPFAEHSPEYQAARWAVEHGAELRFIDLPASDTHAVVSPRDPGEREESPGAVVPRQLADDPIGALASAAGYADGESWWSDVIEENPAPGRVFEAVAEAMSALRAEADVDDAFEAAREAHMRLEIARTAADAEGRVAVVCGAWHVPALTADHSPSDDRALLTGRPTAPVKITWVPWTMPRLALGSGYGAGLAAPGWSAHLWAAGDDPDRDTAWLTRIARALRDRGHPVSTASVIEAQRLGRALASIRVRPAPGFAELSDAAIAVLCSGEVALWHEVSAELLVGSAVGAIPDGVPLAPLLEDLRREQRRTRLKPEALERELAVDLRTESGLARSVLLHRLLILGVPWGKLAGGGRSRGTFRENWVLRWDPEFAVELVDNVVHGSTIAEAASTRLGVEMQDAIALAPLAELVRRALVAGLPAAAEAGIELFAHRAALTSECGDLLDALPPLADIVRYGEARQSTGEHLAELVPRLAMQASLALPYAARDLDDEASGVLRRSVIAAQAALALLDADADVRAEWASALRAVLGDHRTAPLLTGTAARVLYESEQLDRADVVTVFGRMLSPGTRIPQAAGFFEGFFDGLGPRLIHDAVLREAVDGWLMSLDEPDFINHLPLFRRVFSPLDRTERRRLLDALTVVQRRGGGLGFREVPEAVAAWPAHQERVAALLRAGGPR